MTYSTFEHTADIGIEVEAPDLAQAFAEAAYGLTEVITGGRLARPRKTPAEGAVSLMAEDVESLLVRWLSELLFLFEMEGFIVGAAAIRIDEKEGDWDLKGELKGEPYDPQVHGYGSEVKAITYHCLKVVQGPPARVRVILDL